MRQKVSFLISRVKTMVNIRNCTFAILIIAGLSIIFAIVIIMVPEPFQRLFPKARESIATLATAAMVFATLLLAYGTLNIINSDRQREERNKKERLLNEIIEWATDAAKCDYDVDISMPTKTNSKVWLKVNLSKILFNYNLVNAKSEYVKGITLVFEEDLQNAVNRVAQGLFDCIVAMQNRLNDLVDEDTKKKMTESEKSLKLSVAPLITAAAKIKTRDIN